MKETDRARVVVVGAGFAGLHAVRRLAKARIRVLWVDGRNYHCFLPLLYQVATAGLEPQEIAYPARSILRRFPTADAPRDRKSTRLNSSHLGTSYAVLCLKKQTP